MTEGTPTPPESAAGSHPSGPTPSGPPPSFTAPLGPPPTGRAPQPTGPSWDDARALLAGNWLGSGVVAALTLGMSGVVGLGSALLLKPADFGVKHTLDLGAAIAAGIFGAGFDFSGSDEGFDVDGSISVVPLTLSVIVLGALVLLFRRMVRDYPTPGPALGDAARIAVMIGVGVLIPAIVFRGNNDELGRGWGAEVDAQAAIPVDYAINLAGALFLPMLVVFAVLAVGVWSRADWWGDRAQRVRAWLAAPFAGYAAILALLPIVGLIGFLLLGFGDPSLDDIEEEGGLRQVLTLVAILLANGGVWVMSLGSGASAGNGSSATGEPDERDFEHLWHVADDEPGLWASPLLLLVVLAVAAVVVVRRSPSRSHALTNLLVWVAGLLVFLPLLVRLSNLHFTFRLSGASELLGRQSYKGAAVAGADGVSTVLAVWAVAVVVAVVVAFATGSVDLQALRRQLGAFQQVPGAMGANPPSRPPGPPTAPPPPPPPPPTEPISFRPPPPPPDRPRDES